MDFDLIYDIIQYSLLILLLVSSIYILYERFVSNTTLYDVLLQGTNGQNQLFYTFETGAGQPDTSHYPIIFEAPSVSISVVIPSKNEEQKMSQVLETTVRFMQEKKAKDDSFTWEIIVVDDFSTDNTGNIVLGYAHTTEGVQLIRQQQALGIGAAVQVGGVNSRGNLILVADTRTACNIEKLDEMVTRLEQLKNNSCAVVIGSRELEDQSRSQIRSSKMTKLNHVFKSLTKIIGVTAVLDCQCPYVLMTRDAGRWIFPNMHIRGFSCFTEMALIAQRKEMLIDEIDIQWDDKTENPLSWNELVHVGLDLMQLLIFYQASLWTIVKKGRLSTELETL